MLQSESFDVLPKVDPKIFLQDDAEALPRPFYDSLAIGMDRRSLDVLWSRAASGRDPAFQLGGGIDGVGDAADLVWLGLVFSDQFGDALRKNSRLSSACTGHDEHGSVHVVNGHFLALVGDKAHQPHYASCGTAKQWRKSRKVWKSGSNRRGKNWRSPPPRWRQSRRE